MLETLLSKTLFLVASNLGLTYLSYSYFLRKINYQKTWKSFWLMLILPFALLFWVYLLPFPISLIPYYGFGITMGYSLTYSVPHYSRVLQEAMLTTIIILGIVGVWGYRTTSDLSWLGGFLFFGLIGLLIFEIIRLFKISMRTKQINFFTSIFWVLLFTGYILFDFNRLANNSLGNNENWGLALNFATSIYLDIINLFLYLLQLFDSSN